MLSIFQGIPYVTGQGYGDEVKISKDYLQRKKKEEKEKWEKSLREYRRMKRNKAKIK